MKQRGRKPAADLATVATVQDLRRVERLMPPYGIGDEEAEVWLRIVEDQAADAFSGKDADVLAAYCRHVVRGNRIMQLIAQAEGGEALDTDEYDKLLKMHERESRAMSSLATRLRITKQATTNHRGNDQGKKRKAPWQIEG
ncbi:hypothetical protein NM680_10640 [Paracoccus sp. PS-1]|uniref:hypothetical protein n=1 Tax=Paracoccus sp. PS1 TaxID=2963938 RepID=UPI0027E4A0BB|nr:hypothetical protein [Paracoccus sp. PS1]MDQ7262250.1 hypothetical protein [Paracoccus sp. PS1]